MSFHRWILAAALVPVLAACKDKSDDETPINRQAAPEFGQRGEFAPPAPIAQAEIDEDRPASGETRGILGEDPNTAEAGGESVGAHFNQTQHARTVPESAIQLSAVKGAPGKAVSGTAKVYPRGGGEAQLIVELSGAEPGNYAVRLGGECNLATSSEDKAAASGSLKDQSTSTQLGVMVVGDNGQGKLVATLENAALESPDADDFDQQALIVTPARKTTASEPIACGTLSLPDDLGAG